MDVKIVYGAAVLVPDVCVSSVDHPKWPQLVSVWRIFLNVLFSML